MAPDYMARAARMLASTGDLAQVTVIMDALTVALCAARMAGIRPDDLDRMLAASQDHAARLAP